MWLKLHHDADKTPSGCNFIFLLVGKMRYVGCVCSSFEGDGNVFRKLPINKQGNDAFDMLPCLVLLFRVFGKIISCFLCSSCLLEYKSG
jgi:hypothetical protein